MTDTTPWWRLFVAIEVPVDLREQVETSLAPLVASQSEHLRWTRPDTWHITLAFLGNVDPSLGDTVERALSSVASLPAFGVSLAGAGRFGHGILWLGLDDPSYASVRAVGEAVRSSLTRADISFDDRPLHPHLTLARQRDRQGIGVSRSRLAEVDEALAPMGDQLTWPVQRIALFRSHVPSTIADGPVRHERLAVVSLGAN